MAARGHPSWLVIHILTELKTRPMAAKELREELKTRFPTLSPGTFYPAMKKMEREGLVSRSPLPVKMPGRRQSVYTISRAGEEELESVTQMLLSNLQDKIWDILEEDERSALPAAEGAAALVGWRGGEIMILDLAKRLGPNGRVLCLRLPGTDRGPLKSLKGDPMMPEIKEIDFAGVEIPLPDGSVDEVVLGGVLSMFEDKGTLLREVRRVLKPEGVLVLQEMEPVDHVIFTLWLHLSGLGEKYYPVDRSGMETLASMLKFHVLKSTSRAGVNRMVTIKPHRNV